MSYRAVDSAEIDKRQMYKTARKNEDCILCGFYDFYIFHSTIAPEKIAFKMKAC